jgi:hypothetical protein
MATSAPYARDVKAIYIADKGETSSKGVRGARKRTAADNRYKWRPIIVSSVGEDQEMATPVELRGRAARYRQMTLMVTDQRIIDALISLADECEAIAERVEMEEARRQGRQAD